MRIKQKTLVKTIGLLIAVFIFPHHLKGETINETLESAYRTNPQLLASRQSYLSASTDVQLAFSEWLPQVNLQLEYGINKSFSMFNEPNNRGEISASSNTNPWGASIIVNQNIFRGGQIIANVSSSRSATSAAFGDLLVTEQNILLASATAYFNLVRDSAIVRLSRNNVSILKKRLAETRNRFKVGEGTRTLIAFAEARVGSAKTQLANAEAQLVAAQTSYERIIGRKPTGRLGFSKLPNLPKSKEQAQQSALKNHPQLLAARERYNVFATAKTAAYGLFLPSVSVEGVYTKGEELNSQTSSSTNLSVKGKLSMPLYRGGANFATVRKAAYEAERARFVLLDQTRQINEVVFNAWQSLKTARAQISSTTQQIKANRIALNGIRQQQSLGTSTFLDSLDAEQEYLNAQVLLETARRDEQVAAYSLLAASGQLLAKQLKFKVKK